MTHNERGAGSVLAIGVALILSLLAAVSVVLVAWFALIRQAQHTAELAALAGASAGAWLRDSCAAAERVARANGAELEECQVRGDVPNIIVDVAIKVELRPRLFGAPATVTRAASAGTM